MADESVANVVDHRPWFEGVIRFGLCYFVSVLVLMTVSRLSGRWRSGAGAFVLLWSPSVLPWVALAYGALTPLHIWLSVEALLVGAVAGPGLGAGALWIVTHRRLVARCAGVATVTLISIEIALRVFNHFIPSFVFYSGDYNRYRGQPGAPFYDARFNSRGFNDAEHALDTPAGVTRRIVAIGDSFAVGVVPSRSNYLTLLESELAADRSVEVVNMGVAATAPRDYLAILVKEGLAFKPDLVLVGFFIGNDFEAPGRKPYEYSFVATLVHALWRVGQAGVPAAANADGPVAAYRDDEPSLGRDRFLEIEVDRAWVYAKEADALPTATARVAGHFRQMRDIATRAGADFAVVIIPDEVQVNEGLQQEVVPASGLTRDEMDFMLPNRLIAAALANDGIRVLDLAPVFQEQGRQSRLYKLQDTHWNLAGNKLAATAIAAFLKERDELRRGK